MRKILLLILSISLEYSGMSQVVSQYHQSAGEKAIEEYLEAKGQNLSIYNGIQHTGYLPSIKGSAYFKSDAWQKGAVTYDGILYKDALLKYDMVKDELIVQHPGSFLGVTLFSPRVDQFCFLNSQFIYIDKTAASIPEGFYEQLVRGDVNLLVKRKEIIEEKIIFSELNREFLRQDQYYVQKDGKYYAIKNEKALLNLLDEKKQEIQKYLKKNKIKFKRNPEHTLLTIAEQFNQAKD